MNWSGLPSTQTFQVEVYEDGGTGQGGVQEGPGYSTAVVQDFTNLNSQTVTLAGSLTLFCVELGQTNQSSPNTYQILDPNSLQYADATNLPGEPGASTPSGQTFESDAGISQTSGIGQAKANDLMALYGYAFGPNGALASGYNLSNVSEVDQAAFQIAVWQLAYNDEGYIPAGGGLDSSPVNSVAATGFSVTGINASVATEANTLLNAVYTNNGGAGINPMALADLNNGTYQDFLLPESTFTQIPEPPMAAIALGAAALAWALLSRNRCLGAA